MNGAILTGKQRSTVANIQALRGIAALLVIWAHLGQVILKLCPDKFHSILVTPMGAIGVDIFFVISGYVICLSAARSHQRAPDFIAARFVRVVPLYLLVTLVAMLPLFNLRTHRFLFSPLNFDSIWNGFFYLPVFDRAGYTLPPQSVGWTLSFEMWFYLAFALLLNFFNPRRTALVLPVIFAVGALVLMPYHGPFFLVRYLFHPFVLNFCLGCIIYHLQHHFDRPLTFCLLALAVLYFFTFSLPFRAVGVVHDELGSHFDLAWLRIACWGVFAALLVAALVGLEQNRLFLLPKVLVWCGEISYSLYLVHPFALWQVERLGLHLGLRSPFLISAAVFTLALFFGWLCHAYVERPVTDRVRELWKSLTAPRPETTSTLQPSLV